ncbi:DNA uptake protein [Veronia nyctiphanis]|uniref:DNA uptake protein n=1 Tax=Veronia nyctiphanis TaxID=1278244 RepID=A0A4V1LTC4_9GAMM|nr:ComEA family DNA-binding protein [Veronia nyctiphanis]RXJ74708.1 DNA uptake protein [Veronia nyctiphanis]
MKNLVAAVCFAITIVLSPISVAEDSMQVQVEMVNINTADVDELDKILLGIGVKKAQAIVDYRNEFGPFLSIEDITNVKGIGESTLDKNRDRIKI